MERGRSVLDTRSESFRRNLQKDLQVKVNEFYRNNCNQYHRIYSFCKYLCRKIKPE